jgi:phosphoglycerate dehydrogenase-like enzyme
MSDRLVLHPLHGPGLPEALAAIPGVDLIVPHDSDRVVGELEGGAGLLVTYLWEDRFLVPGLRWVQAISAGTDQFPDDDLAAAGVVLTSARGAHTPAVAEHAIALLLTLIRGIGPAMRDVPERAWRIRPATEARGRTLGVLGLGSIGGEIARLAAALGMRVIGTKRSPGGYRGPAERVLGPDGTLEVCREADAVVIALPGADAPAVGAPELAALEGGWLVNVGRGSAVDEAALVEALQGGRLLGAGLDVFTAEPLPAGSPLWDLPNVVITPHAAWASDRLAPRVAEIVAANLAAHRGEGPWRNRLA